MGSVYNMFYKIQLLFIGAALAAPSSDNGEKKFPKMTPEAAASCDPDYGWINGPEGTNKCYMILKETEITNCGLGNGGGGGGVCSPDYYNCYAECYDPTCCYDYSCSGGSYYYSVNWYEAMQCCVLRPHLLLRLLLQWRQLLLLRQLVRGHAVLRAELRLPRPALQPGRARPDQVETADT